MDKKSNMAYWDEIDDMSEEFVRQFAGCAAEKLELDDNDVTDIAKTVQTAVIDAFKSLGIDTDKHFPYVNENY